jgi:hypothetical protein
VKLLVGVGVGVGVLVGVGVGVVYWQLEFLQWKMIWKICLFYRDETVSS